MLRLTFLTLLSVCSLPTMVGAELPRAFGVSPMGVAPGQRTTISVTGQNLKGTTDLWTNLPARVTKVKPASDQVREIKSSFVEGKKAPKGALIREAESFDRGQFRKTGTFIVNGGHKPNFAEWDFELNAPGNFILEFMYASGEARPTKLFLNGRLLTSRAAIARTGGFGDKDSKWIVEGVIRMRKGANTLRLERTGGTPHFDKLALVPTTLAATQYSTVVPSDRIAPFVVDVPQSTPVGIRGLRVATPKGISELVLFMVDDLPTTPEIRGQNSDGQSQSVKLPTAIEGYCDVGLVDRYSFEAKAGDAISIETVAARIGSRLDPVIRLLDSKGDELAFVDDSPGLAGDCCRRYRFERDGQYVVTIEDALMSGGSAHRYRLRIGDFPLITSTVPAAIQRGTQATISFAGQAVAGLTPLNLEMADANSPMSVSHNFPGRIGSGFCELTVSEFPQVIIDEKPRRKAVSIPSGISGVLRQPGQSHVCRMQLKKGERIRVRDVSRSKGLPALLSLSVRDLEGKTLASIRRAGIAGQELKWTAPADGQYELQIAELNGRGGSEFAYHLEVTHDVPDFHLTVEQDKTILPQRGYTLLKISTKRSGYNGPIQLAVEGLGKGVQLRNDVIAEKKNETRLKVYLPKQFQPGQSMAMQIIGTATINGKRIERKASTLAALRKTIPQTPFPPNSLTGLVAGTASHEIPDFFALAVDGNSIQFPRFVGEVYFTVRVKNRAKGFTVPVNIRIEGLPNGFRAGGGERPVSRSQNNEYRFQLNGPRDIDRKQQFVQVIAEASYKGQTKEVALKKVPLQVIDPLIVTATLSKPSKSADARKLTIRARRFVPRAGGDQKKIDIELQSLPVGINVPNGIAIAAGKNEVTVPLKVDPKIKPTALKTVKVIAHTIVAGNKVEATATIGLEK